MTIPRSTTTTDGRDLTLTCILNAPPAKIFRAWTDPILIAQWLAPPPWKTTSAEMDVCVGGSSLIVMRGPDGAEILNRWVYLEVVPDQKLVLTNAYTNAWELSEKAFFTFILTLEDLGGKTRYTAVTRHWTIADREAHEKLGFHQGWPIATEQLAALVE